VARDVVPLRLSESEKARIAKAAAGQRLTLSEFLRRAALAIAYRLEQTPREPESEPEPRPKPRPALDEPHVVRTYRSFEEYKHGRGGIPPGPGIRDVG